MIKIVPAPSDEWQRHCNEQAFKATFGDALLPTSHLLDLALLAIDTETDRPIGFVTIKNEQRHIARMNVGGMFVKGHYTAEAFKKAVAWLKGEYKAATMEVENGNVAMLKLAMNHGFLVIGTRHFIGRTFLELFLDFEEA